MNRREAIKRTAALLGLALTPSLLAGALRAQTMPVSANGKPRYLNAAQFATADAIAERIVPRTDTPGASDVGVPAFLDLMYGEFMTPDEKRVFAAGLSDVEKASTRAHRREFFKLSVDEQDALLKKIAEAAQKKEKTFFHLIKDLTLTGYFTSEEIGKKVLHYDPIPGPFRACVPISEVGNVAWTR